MFEILNSLFPVFIVIIFGYATKHLKLLSDEFWPSCEKLVYYALLPILLFINIFAAEYQNIASYFSMIISAISAISIIILLLFLGKNIFGIKNPNFTSLFQGSTYSNAAYIGIPSTYALFGQEGLVVYCILIAVMVPFVNAVTIIVLSIYSNGKNKTIFKTIAQKLVFHPIILACVLGFLFSYLAISLPELILNPLEIMGKAAIPLGLMVVGGALNIKSTRGYWRYIISATAIKLIALPLIIITLAKFLDVSKFNTQILIMYAALPTAAATYLLAKKMNGNAPLMAGIIVFETLISLITMSFILTH
ncbi:MAG: putative permease [Lentimonas sp.]|jgi:predicted permease